MKSRLYTYGQIEGLSAQGKNSMSYLVARIEWLDRYNGPERYDPYMGYGRAGNIPHEIFNFLEHEDGNCYGYVQVPQNGNIRIEKLGAGRQDVDIGGCTVLFIARRPNSRDYFLVGAFRDCVVFREPRLHPSREVRKLIGDAHFHLVCRVEQAILIPPASRRFSLEYRGRAQIFYGINADLITARDVEEYLDDQEAYFVPSAGGEESRAPRLASRYERSGAARRIKLAGVSELECEGCGLRVPAGANASQRAVFEVHHRFPMSLLKTGATRKVSASDLALLCANCHRLIHRMSDVSDVKALRSEPKAWRPMTSGS